MVVCWVCAMPVVRVVDDGVDPGRVRWCMAEAGRRVLKEETERAASSSETKRRKAMGEVKAEISEHVPLWLVAGQGDAR